MLKASALTLLISLGCASADGTPHQQPSPEAQHEPYLVTQCDEDTAFLSWETPDGIVHVSQHVETTNGGAKQTAVVQHYSQTPPFDAEFGDTPIRVFADLSVCALNP